MASNAFLPCCHRAVTVAPIIDVSAAETRETADGFNAFLPCCHRANRRSCTPNELGKREVSDGSLDRCAWIIGSLRMGQVQVAMALLYSEAQSAIAVIIGSVRMGQKPRGAERGTFVQVAMAL